MSVSTSFSTNESPADWVRRRKTFPSSSESTIIHSTALHRILASSKTQTLLRRPSLKGRRHTSKSVSEASALTPRAEVLLAITDVDRINEGEVMHSCVSTDQLPAPSPTKVSNLAKRQIKREYTDMRAQREKRRAQTPRRKSVLHRKPSLITIGEDGDHDSAVSLLGDDSGYSSSYASSVTSSTFASVSESSETTRCGSATTELTSQSWLTFTSAMDRNLQTWLDPPSVIDLNSQTCPNEGLGEHAKLGSLLKSPTTTNFDSFTFLKSTTEFDGPSETWLDPPSPSTSSPSLTSSDSTTLDSITELSLNDPPSVESSKSTWTPQAPLLTSNPNPLDCHPIDPEQLAKAVFSARFSRIPPSLHSIKEPEMNGLHTFYEPASPTSTSMVVEPSTSRPASAKHRPTVASILASPTPRPSIADPASGTIASQSTRTLPTFDEADENKQNGELLRAKTAPSMLDAMMNAHEACLSRRRSNARPANQISNGVVARKPLPVGSVERSRSGDSPTIRPSFESIRSEKYEGHEEDENTSGAHNIGVVGQAKATEIGIAL